MRSREGLLALGVAWMFTVALGSTPVLPQASGLARPSSGCGKSPLGEPGVTYDDSLRVGGLDRSFRVHLPPKYSSRSARPLVLDFHGYTSTASNSERYTKLSQHADENEYIVVYPQSTSFKDSADRTVTSWNDLAGSKSAGPLGPTCAEGAFDYPTPPECGEAKSCVWASCHDDLAFVDAMLESLEEELCIDVSRIYATGMSNGGMFVHRLGCDMADRFAAIAPVSGTLARGFACSPGRTTPVGMINIYGVRDDYVSQKGVVSSDGYYYSSAVAVLDAWSSDQGQACEQHPVAYKTKHAGTRDLSCTERPNCESGTRVVHCGWDGDHDWPAGDGNHFGNDLIWDFFTQHQKPDL